MFGIDSALLSVSKKLIKIKMSGVKTPLIFISFKSLFIYLISKLNFDFELIP